MKRLLLVLFFHATAFAQSPGERMIADYFRNQTRRVAENALAQIHSLDDWKAQRGVYREQLLEMLGLAPLPSKTDLKATMVGRIDSEKFTVEKIHFQSMPGLYVTASLYLPKGQSGPAPAILYVCGHARVFKDGVAYGNKAGYQHHPAWYAEHGYVALIIDTLDLGEIVGEHHGTSRRGWWSWPTRGYTPAGVETWNAVRAMDYLATRREVDMDRIGLTGRSGGGAYTWFVAAIDDRPSVLVPVAGITDMTNHVIDGCIEGHCDCMYQVNTYAWDFATLAALSAPRPLLVANSDSDRIFPLDGVVRIHEKLKRIYKLHGAEAKLGLFISPGPHLDTQELQLASFRWMNRWLKKDEAPVAELAVKRFTPEELKVFTTIPADEINTRIHDTFVAKEAPASVPSSRPEWQALSARWRAVLREKTFNNWPGLKPDRLRTKVERSAVQNSVQRIKVEFSPDEAFRLQAHVFLNESGTNALTVRLGETGSFNEEDPDRKRNAAVAFVLPRGAGPDTSWPAAKDLQIRRRFLLLGQSLETMQVWDVRAALAALSTLPELKEVPITLEGEGPMSIVALFASLFEDSVTSLRMKNPPATLAAGLSFPNALRYFDLPQIVALALPRSIVISGSTPAAWDWSVRAAKTAGGTITLR